MIRNGMETDDTLIPGIKEADFRVLDLLAANGRVICKGICLA